LLLALAVASSALLWQWRAYPCVAARRAPLVLFAASALALDSLRAVVDLFVASQAFPCEARLLLAVGTTYLAVLVYVVRARDLDVRARRAALLVRDSRLVAPAEDAPAANGGGGGEAEVELEATSETGPLVAPAAPVSARSESDGMPPPRGDGALLREFDEAAHTEHRWA
jgi:hypothetical protein